MLTGDLGGTNSVHTGMDMKRDARTLYVMAKAADDERLTAREMLQRWLILEIDDGNF